MHRNLKVWLLTLSFIFIAPFQCYATSIVVLVTKEAIVVGVDGKETISHTQPLPSSSGTATKGFLLHGRIAVATAGNGGIRQGSNVRYSFIPFIEEVESRLEPTTTISDAVDFLKDHLTQRLTWVDGLLESKAIRPEHFDFSDRLFDYSVAGFEAWIPKVFIIELDVNWDELSLKNPRVTQFDPFKEFENLFPLVLPGKGNGYEELFQPNSSTRQSAIARFPVEIVALLNDQELTVDQTKRLARILLQIEIESDPTTVGFPLTIMTIPMQGAAAIDTYDDTL